MGDEQHGRAGIVDQRSQQIDDLPLCDRIQCSSRLVCDDQSRRGDQRRGDADALLLAARQLMWIFEQRILGKTDFRQHRLDTLRPLFKRQVVMEVQRQSDLLGHCHHGIQRDGWVLEHHAHGAAAQGGHDLIGGADNMCTIQVDVAAYLRHTGEDSHHGFGDHRLAGAG